MMKFNKIIWIVEQPARADKSALGAVNRPLLDGLPTSSLDRLPTSYTKQAEKTVVKHRTLEVRCPGTGRVTMWVIHTPTDVRSILFISIIVPLRIVPPAERNTPMLPGFHGLDLIVIFIISRMKHARKDGC
jgi:hypothetical protein